MPKTEPMTEAVRAANTVLLQVRLVVAKASPEARAVIAEHVQMARTVLDAAKQRNDGAPLVAMLMVALEAMLEDDEEPAHVTH